MKHSIESLIPHRHPFLFVDAIVDHNDTGATAIYKVNPDLNIFKGHFPGKPIVPGVILTEMIAQSCAAFLALKDLERSPEDEDSIPLLAGSQMQFFKGVFPNDQLTIRVSVERHLGRFIIMNGDIFRDADRCVKGTVTLTTQRNNE